MTDIRLRDLWGKTAALGVAGVLAGAAAGADDRLTLVDAVTRGLSFHRSVQAPAAQVEAAESTVDEAEAAPFPTVSLGATATHYQDRMIAHPIHAFVPPWFLRSIRTFSRRSRTSAAITGRTRNTADT